MIATSGDVLLDPAAVDLYEKELFPVAALITPNLDEAGQLLGKNIQNLESMKRAGQELEREFKTAILLKGGHLAGDVAVDRYAGSSPDSPLRQAAEREESVPRSGVERGD